MLTLGRAPTPGPTDLLAILDAGPIDPEALAFMSRQRRKRALDGIDALIAALDALDPDPDLEPTMGFVMPGEVDEAEPDTDEEPSLGAPDVEFNVMTRRIECHGHIDQRRWADGRCPTGEDEPSYGSREGSACDWHWPGQAAWSAGYQRQSALDECEPVSEDEGACIQSQPHDDCGQDQEPTLGAPDGVTDQRLWSVGGTMFIDELEASLGSPEIHHDQRRWGQGEGSRELDHDEHPNLLGGRWQDREPLKLLRRDTEAMLRRRDLLPNRGGNISLLTADMLMCSGVAW